MNDYIDHKKDWKRCYSNNSKNTAFLNWNLEDVGVVESNVMDVVPVDNPLYEVLLRRTPPQNNWNIAYYVLPDQKSELEKQFDELADKWKEETGFFSIDKERINNTFLSILSLGNGIVPFILKDMQKPTGTASWHIALKILTKSNPIPNEYLGNSKLMKETWIKWGKDNDII